MKTPFGTHAARSPRRGRRHPARAHAVAVVAARRLHGARPRGRAAKLTSFAALTAFKQTSASQFTKRAARADPKGCAPSSPQKSPPPGPARRSGTGEVLRPNTTCVAARACPGRLRSASAAPSSAGLVARARSALRELTCRRLFERSERSERSEFGDGPRDRAAQGSLSEAKTAEVKRSSLPGRAFASPTDAHQRRASATSRHRTLPARSAFHAACSTQRSLERLT